MAELIVFPDVEDAVRVTLTAGFALLPSYASVTATTGTKPATLPAEFVHVTRTGGPSSLVVDAAQITLETYAKRGSRAVAIAQMARAILHAAGRDGSLAGLIVYRVNDFNGPYSDPDPNAPTFTRYSATYAVSVRGSAV